ncbi:MAG: ABC transporter permease [Oscillospiraceae bacterium]|nr:ABC transporter permease [Oscillospiraceae bacterium]
MKLGKHLRSLYRSPLKTGLTLLLLAAAAFLFLYNLSEYSVSDREYREARDRYEGVLTVEDVMPPERKNTLYDYFLLADPTNPAETYGKAEYADSHHESLRRTTQEEMAALPHISRVERRYMTAGVSPDYIRLETDWSYFPYYARCVLAGTVTQIQPAFGGSILARAYPEVGEEGFQAVSVMDWEVLAGDEAWLRGDEEQRIEMWLLPDELKGSLVELGWADFNTRFCFLTLDPDYFWSDFERLEVGRRYVFVLRNNRADGHSDSQKEAEESEAGIRNWALHRFYMGDDTRKGWWPYVTDITDLPETYLETEEFAPLRELIQVTNDDVHTFDVVYTGDMAAIRRVAQGRIVCEEGRFLTPADEGQPVCVVNTDVLEAYGLKVGDTLTLDLGNYLCEQYAPLGAIASTQGRHATEFTRQEFTIVGSWRDLNEGKHAQRDLYWCYSNNAIFVPASFLPDCVNKDTYEAKPGEVSFIVGAAEEIVPFMEEVLPNLEAEDRLYEFSDGGWSIIAEDLIQARSLALVKLLIFAAAALFALVLTVWLFIGRKKREYGILRALGMPKGEAGNRLFIPFLLLGILSAVLGLIIARIVTLRQLTAAAEETAIHEPAGIGLFLLGAVSFLILLAAIALVGLGLIRRKSVLELVQEKNK